MRTTSLIALTILLFASAAFSQEGQPAGWVRSLEAGLLLTQNQYSDNWAGSETGSLTWTFNSLATAKRQLTPKLHVSNTLKLAFGQTHSQDEDSRDWKEPTKSTDLVDFETVLRRKIGMKLDPFVAGRVETQFLDSRDTTQTRSFNPLKFTESMGFSKTIFEDDVREWTTRLGFALHQYRDGWGDKSSSDGGVELVSDYTSPLAADNITLTSKLVLFQALMNSEKDDMEGLPNADYWKTLDVTWENIFTARITEYLNVNLYMQLLYDKEVDLAGRFKETLSLGLTYKFAG